MKLNQRLLRHCLYLVVLLTCCQATTPMTKDFEYFNVIEKLHTTLLQRYNKQIRPVLNHTQTLDIKTSFDMTSFDFNELESHFSARGYFYMSWKDPRFTWSPSDYDGLKSIHLPDNKIWIPDFEVYNTAGVVSDARSFATNTEVLILSDGTVLYVPLCNLISTCIPNPTYYPFETVTCKMTIGSWTHDALKMNIVTKDNATKVSVEDLVSPIMSSWSLLDTDITIDTKIYPCCPDESYQSLKVSFIMKRSFSTLKAITTPTITIMVLTLVTFFIPPMVSAKLLVGMFNMVMICSYLLYFHSTLPSGNLETPLIVSFYSGSLILVIISITTSILSLRWIRLSKSSSPPEFLMKCFVGSFGRILGIPNQENRNHSLENDSLTEKSLKFTYPEIDRQEIVKQQWVNLCLVVDRVMLIAYCAIFTSFLISYVI